MAVGNTRRHDRSDEAAAIDCTSIADLGCEVIGTVTAQCDESSTESATGSQFVSWIDSGHRLEDWDTAALTGDEGDAAA